ncbi:hypothetical protein L596_000667 [Steinernema carpocapsae]|uniref:Bile acid:sodium symporter n=1 Tax=Steinernema carpocapsae TaxID=34508 RepID=A0A4U8UIW3_STECR|nr:hypothetical protein L596_000667 [Steinernema carpocapsae]
MKIVSSLLALVIPLLIGVGIQKWKPNIAAKARKLVMRPYIICVLVFVIAFGAYANSYMFFVMTVPALIGGLLLPWCGFMFGCFASILLRQPPANVTAIAIETGIQNTGIAILLLKFSFSEPDADISALIPVIVASFTPAPLLLGMLVHRVIKAMRKRNMSDDDAKDNELGMDKESAPVEPGTRPLPPFPPASPTFRRRTRTRLSPRAPRRRFNPRSHSEISTTNIPPPTLRYFYFHNSPTFLFEARSSLEFFVLIPFAGTCCVYCYSSYAF